MFEFSYVGVSLTGIFLWVRDGLKLSCLLCLVFAVMVFFNLFYETIGL